MSRLSIEISKEQHQQIKAIAAMRGMTIKDLILDRVIVQKSNNDQEKLEKLRKALVEGEESGFVADFDWDAHRSEMIAKYKSKNG